MTLHQRILINRDPSKNYRRQLTNVECIIYLMIVLVTTIITVVATILALLYVSNIIFLFS
jgi:hypothetical protein